MMQIAMRIADNSGNTLDVPEYHRDHLGNNRMDVAATGGVHQITHYYPFGMPMDCGYIPAYQRWLFGDKEFDRTSGLDLYDFEARAYDPALGRFRQPDPLAEKYRPLSPYLYCSGSPVNRIDPTGMGDFYTQKKYLGSYGINDNKRYVINPTKESYNESGGESVPGAGLSKKDEKKAIKFIKNNSGNSQAFHDNNSIYDNFTQIESRPEVLSEMEKTASMDNGSGGISATNNQEHGGHIENGRFVQESSGEVNSPDADRYASISLYYGDGKMHTHPSGSKIGANDLKYQYAQHPSMADLQNAGGNINYVIGCRNNVVYIYDHNVILAEIKRDLFFKLIK